MDRPLRRSGIPPPILFSQKQRYAQPIGARPGVWPRAGPNLPGMMMFGFVRMPMSRLRPRRRLDPPRRWRSSAPVEHRQLQPGQFFDVAQQRPLGAIAKRNRDARGAGPRGAADPVNIGFRHFGKLEIDDMRDAVDVEAARRDVGCDEGTDAAAAKRVQRTFPLALALVAVNRASRDPAVIKMLGDLVGAAFRPSENKRPGHSRIAEKLDEKIPLAACFNEHDLVVDAAGGCRNGGHGHFDRIDEKVASEGGDFVWHRRREKQVLPAFWKGADDPPDGLDETEIEHAIGLVEDEEFGLAEASRAGVEVILEAAWGRDQNVEAARERLDLRAMRHAAEDGGDRHGKARAKAPEALGDLARQFAGRAQNQHAAAMSWSSASVRREIMEDGKREGRCLAGAGLGYADEIAARHDGRNCLCLDRRWMRVTLFCQSMQKRRGEAEPGEISQLLVFL